MNNINESIKKAFDIESNLEVRDGAPSFREVEYVVCINDGNELTEYMICRDYEEAKEICDYENEHLKKFKGKFEVRNKDLTEKFYPKEVKES